MVPNIDGTIWHTLKTRKHPRHGTQRVILYPTNRNPAQSLQENAITVFGPRLYNSLPKYLRDIKSVKTEKFKFELDKFLDTIPDQPKIPIKEFTTVVESPTRPWSCFEASPSIQVNGFGSRLNTMRSEKWQVASSRFAQYEKKQRNSGFEVGTFFTLTAGTNFCVLPTKRWAKPSAPENTAGL